MSLTLVSEFAATTDCCYEHICSDGSERERERWLVVNGREVKGTEVGLTLKMRQVPW